MACQGKEMHGISRQGMIRKGKGMCGKARYDKER
jgi:hypothetical protein